MSIRSSLLLACLASFVGCQPSAAPPSDAPPAEAAGVTTAAINGKAPTGATAAVTALSPPVSIPGLLDCQGSLCAVEEVTDAVQRQLDAMSPRPRVDFKGKTQAQFATLARLTWLKDLSTQNGTLTDLTPLATLTQLEALRLGQGELRTLAGLRGHPSLKHLVLHSLADVSEPWPGETRDPALPHQISPLDGGDIDLSALSSLPKLEILSLSGIKIPRAAVLAGLPKLRSLTLSHLTLTETAPLESYSHLRRLQLWDVQVPSWAFLGKLSGLELLSLTEERLSEVNALAPLTRLRTLVLNENPKLSSLKPLEKMSELEDLEIKNSAVSDLSPLGRLAMLRTLEVSGSRVSDLKIARKLPMLAFVGAGNTTVLDASPLLGLKALERVVLPPAVPENQIADLKAALPSLQVTRPGG
jgi:hypothetical protein